MTVSGKMRQRICNVSIKIVWMKLESRGFCHLKTLTVYVMRGMAPVHQNVHKALCADGLNARMLKEYSNEISPVLALIFNESLARGDVTDDWQQANSSQMLIRSLIR